MAPTIKTSGIVLSCIKYGENCVIVNILTEEMGRQAYMVKLTGQIRRTMLPLMQPLTIVDLEAYLNPHQTVQKIKEAHIAHPLVSIPFDPVKRAIAMFMTELVVKTLRSDEPDTNIYKFVHFAVETLDDGLPGIYNFHIFFMFKLARFLGFEPDMSLVGYPVFDLQEGQYRSSLPIHRHILTGDDLNLWSRMAELSIDSLASVPFSQSERQRLINLLEQYYILHIPTFNGLNSASVLHQLF